MKTARKFLSLILASMLILATLSFPAMAKEEISGECLVSVYESGTTSYDYKLLANDSEVPDATYTVSASTEDDISSYASIDADGKLSLTPEAAGKNLLVAATSDLYESSMLVNVASEPVDYEIQGTDYIMRAPEGSYAINPFTVPGYEGEITWEISDTWTATKADGNTEDTPKPNGVSINNKGELLVSGSAPDAVNTPVTRENNVLENTTFKVIAKNPSNEVIDEKTVTYVNELNTWSHKAARIYDDFEKVTPNGASWVTRGLGGTMDILQYTFDRDNGSVDSTVSSDATGNSYVKGDGREAVKWGTCSSFVIEPQNLAKMTGQPYITMEAKFNAEYTQQIWQGHNIWFVADSYKTNEATKGSLDVRFHRVANGGTAQINTYMNEDGTGLGAASVRTTVNMNTWITARVEINTINGTFDLFVNDEKVAENVPTAIKGENAKIPYIMMGTSVDDFAMYSGRKLTNFYEIDGEDTILLPPKGESSKIKYSATEVVDGLDGNVSFALADNYTGLTMSDDTLTVDGSTATEGSYVINAISNGAVVGTKTLTIPGYLNDYIERNGVSGKDYLNRFFDDFQTQIEGLTTTTDKSQSDNGQSINSPYTINTWAYSSIGYYGGGNAAYISSVAKEEDGNLYIKAKGQHNGAWSSGSSLLAQPTNDTNYNPRLIKSSKQVTLTSRFKPDTSLPVGYNSLWFVSDTTNIDPIYDKVRLDIRQCFTDESKQYVGIYSHMNSDGTGMKGGYSGGDLLCIVDSGKWFDARAEITFANGDKLGSFDLYINNVLVGDDIPTSATNLNNIFIGTDVDDIGIYSGVGTSQLPAEYKKLSVQADGKALTESGGKYQLDQNTEASAHIYVNDEYLKDKTKDKKLIIASYGEDNELWDVAITNLYTSSVDATSGTARVKTTGAAYVKVFIWDMTAGSLTPLR